MKNYLLWMALAVSIVQTAHADGYSDSDFLRNQRNYTQRLLDNVRDNNNRSVTPYKSPYQTPSYTPSYQLQVPWERQRTYSERLLDDFNAKLARANASLSKPALTFDNKQQLITFYIGFGLDYFQAERVVRGEFEEAQRQQVNAQSAANSREQQAAREIYRKDLAERTAKKSDIERRAAAGEATAMGEWAAYYSSDVGDAERLARYERAANAGDTPSMSYLLDRYQSKEYKDADKAHQWLNKLVNMGDEHGTLIAASALMESAQPEEAIALLKKSYAQNPSVKIAALISSYAVANDDVPQAVAWAQTMMKVTGKDRYFYPLSLLSKIPLNAQSAPAVLEMLQTVASRNDKADAARAAYQLGQIFDGTEPQWHGLVAVDRARSDAAYLQAARADFDYVGPVARGFYQRGDAAQAESLFADITKDATYSSRVAIFEAADFWSTRDDGKADGGKAIALYRQSDMYGDSSQIWGRIGDIYRLGLGRAKDVAIAVESYRYGVPKYDYLAVQRLAFCLWNGIGTERDESAALAALDAVKKWNSVGGDTMEQKRQTAFEATRYRYIQAARTDKSVSGASADEALRRFAPQFLQFAQDGEPAAQTVIGSIILNNIWRETTMTEQDGWNWIEKASVSDPNAQLQWGARLLGLYETDATKRDGQPTDRERAVQLLIAAAKQDEAQAGWILAQCYSEGWGVEKDPTKVREWLFWGAKKHDIAAVHMLGTLLLESPKASDQSRAASMARARATSGDPWGQNLLGVALLKGWGVAQDVPQALEWFDKAAQSGDWTSARNAAKTRYMGAAGVPAQGDKALTALEEYSGKTSGGALNMAKLYAGEDDVHPWFAPNIEKARQWIGKVQSLYEIEKSATSGAEPQSEQAKRNLDEARKLEDKIIARDTEAYKAAQKTVPKAPNKALQDLKLKPVAKPTDKAKTSK